MFARRTSAVSLVAVLLAGCATAPMSGPEVGADWQVRTGQAVWTPPGRAMGIAGELMVATNAAGDFVVEFAKPPFTIATARREEARWQVEFPAEEKRYGGRGRGPGRILWLQFVPAIQGRGGDWKFEAQEDGSWSLARKGEKLEGYLAE